MFNKLFNREKPESRQDAALAIVTGALSQSTAQGLGSVREWLDGHAEAMMQKQTCIETLAHIDDALRQLLLKAEQELYQAHANLTRTQLILQAALPFCTVIANTTARAVAAEGPTLAKRSGQIGAVQSAIASFVYWAAKGYLMRFIGQPQAAGFPWVKIYPLYDFARKIEAGTLSKFAGSATSGLGQIKKQLAYLLLLTRTLSPDLNGRQILVADRLVAMFTAFVQVADQHSADTPFATAQDNGQPTLLDDNAVVVASQQPAFYFGVQRCSTELVSLETMITMQHRLPPKLEEDWRLDIGEALTVVRHLKARWSGRQSMRRDKRIQAQGNIQLAYEFAPVRRLISLMENAAQVKTMEPTRTVGELENISQSGLGVILSPNATWARSGRLIGIRQAEAPRWSVGVVRRIVARTDGSSLAGIQVVSSAPESVRLVERAKVSQWERVTSADTFNNVLAIYAPKTESVAARLITSGNTLSVGQEYGASLVEGNALIKILDVAELGGDFVIYDCDVLIQAPPADEPAPRPHSPPPRLNII